MAPSPDRPTLAPFLAALGLAGVAQAFVSTPANLVVLHLFTFAPALVVLSRATGRRAWLGGWLLGAAANAAIFAWLMPTVERFTTLGTAGGVGVLALFAGAFGFYGAVFGWGAAAVRRASGPLWPLGLAAWFVACEFLNPQLFPYSQGVAWFQVPRVFLVAALTGVPGVTFLVLAWNGVLAAAWERWRRRDDPEARRALRASSVAFAAVLVGALGYAQARQGQIDEAVARAETRRFALIQTNVDVPAMRAMFKQDRTAYRDDLLALSREALRSDPTIDVLVWPEGAVRGRLTEPKREGILALAREFDVSIWTGVVESRGRGEGRTRHNGAYVVAPDGSLSAPYDKNILVPFGEYMPLVSLLPVLGTIRSFPSVTPGREPAILSDGHAGVDGVAFLVCYEATRPRYLRRQAELGAELLATVTFDGWFGDTAALDQHMMLAASMSAVTGLPQVRAATTGISIATGPDGVLLGRTRRAEREWIALDVPLAAVRSPYTRWGDWFAHLCVLLGFLAVWAGRPAGGGGFWRRAAWVLVPGVFLAAAPLAWAINPHTPVSDRLVWAAAGILLALTILPRRDTVSDPGPHPAPRSTP